MAGTGAVTPEAVVICRNGVHNVLHHLGVLERTGKPPTLLDRPALHEIGGPPAYVMATQTGVFEPRHALGDAVRAGQTAGRIHFLSDPARTPEELVYGADGVVYGLRHPGRVRPGNCCVVVASICE